MPQYYLKYKDEKQDGRKRLEEFQREEIREKYRDGGVSLNGLAVEYGVSKKLVLLLVNLESKRKNSERIKKHWRDYQKKGKEWAEVMRKVRAKKVSLGLVTSKKPPRDGFPI